MRKSIVLILLSLLLLPSLGAVKKRVRQLKPIKPESVSIDWMLHKHVQRVLRQDGSLILPVDWPVTNYMDRVVMTGADALTSGYYYFRLRDEDSAAQIFDQHGDLVRVIPPNRPNAEYMLADLFGFELNEDTPEYLKLSHVTSKWRVFNSKEEDEAYGPTEEELEAASYLAMRMRVSRLADAPNVVTTLQCTAHSVNDRVMESVYEWPSTMTFANDKLDIFVSSGLETPRWYLFDTLDVAGLNSVTTTVNGVLIPGWHASIPLTHLSTCFATTNIVEDAFELGSYSTNIYWNCDCRTTPETPGFNRAAEHIDSDGDGLSDYEERWQYDTDPEDWDSDDDGIADGDEVDYGLDPKVNSNNVDSDNDNLSDADECRYGTDPNNPDTDGDGLNDGTEVAMGLDPTDEDSDDDGLRDGDELLIGTDPNNPDTDDDWLLDGQEIGLSVATPFATRSATLPTYNTSPTNPDSDGDGMKDGWEVENAFDPTSNSDRTLDADNDFVSNIVEYINGTDPHNPDTDYDGVSDYWEIHNGDDPLVWETTDNDDSVWVSVTGDTPCGQNHTVNSSVTIPAHTKCLVAVYVGTDEVQDYMYYGNGDSFFGDDYLEWNVWAAGARSVNNPTLSGSMNINENFTEFIAAEGNHVRGVTSGACILKDAAVFEAKEAPVTLSIHAAAGNRDVSGSCSRVDIAVCYIRVAQRNYPNTKGSRNGTTDMGGAGKLVYISDSNQDWPEELGDFPCGIAYITGDPAAPDLRAYVMGLTRWNQVEWWAELESERSERGTVDNRNMDGRHVVLDGETPFNITQHLLDGEIVGGNVYVHAKIDNRYNLYYTFKIRGKNPKDADVESYINSTVDDEFRSYARLIAKHESHDARSTYLYCQFNAEYVSYYGLPCKTAGKYYGWGIAQIDRGSDPNNCSTAEVYDWHQNIRSMNAKLVESRNTYLRFLRYFRTEYGNSPNWTEPDSTFEYVYGIPVSIRQWAIMIFYNGTRGAQEMQLAGAVRTTPFSFDGNRWKAHKNDKDYVRKVYEDRNMQATE